MQVKTYGSSTQSKKSAKNKNSKKLRILLAVLGTLVAGFIVVAILIGLEITSDDYSSIMSTPEVVVKDSEGIQDAAVAEPIMEDVITYNGKKYQKNNAIVNLLFLGVDSSSERVGLGYRSDMMMICAVDTANKTATLLSIPRDTYTNVDKIDDHTGNVINTELNRLNAAYAFGGGPNNYSAANSMSCIQRFLERRCDLVNQLGFTLDIPVNFYASLNMDGITQVCKAVDGVEVTLDTNIPGVGRKGETVTLKYDKAEAYLRNRHHSEGSDFGRTSHQRTFMIALAKKVKSMGAVDIILNLYDELEKYVRTNLNTDQMLDFAKILKNVDIDSIQQLTIPGESKTIDGSSVVIHDEQGTLEMLLSIYYTEVQ